MDSITHAGTLHGHGETGALFHSFDWSSTELGSPGSWPDSLTIATSICLNSRFPMVLWWGRSTCTMIYNDAYRSVLSRTKHPRSFGRSGRECCREIWDTIGPMVDQVFETGEPTWSEDMLLFIDRDLPREEAYFTISCSAIYEERDRVGGVLSAYTETTRRALSEQRLGVLRDLGARASEGRTPEQACEIARQTLDEAKESAAFALFYLVERRQARLVARSPHLNPHVAPERVDLTAPGASAWRLANVAASGVAEVIEDVFERVGPLPGGIWPEPARSALVVPLKAPGGLELAGVLVIGAPARRVVDLQYRTFIDCVAGHVASAIADARVHEHTRRRTDASAELDRAKTVFFRNISQEFRTPLTLMLGPAEDALTDTEDALAPAQRERVETIYRGGQRLLKLVNTLLDFTRLEAGRIDACYEPTDLASLTSEVVSVFREVVERAGLQLVVDCLPLPEPVYVDREMWEHIVLSLLSNAFKFTFNGEIVVRTVIDRGRARLTVRDTGTGIREAERPLLFTRFHRVTGARARTDEGTGIGLSLVHGMARLHRGQVEVQSEYGRGSTFTVTIPTGRAHLPADRIKAPQAPAPAAALARTYVAEAAQWLLGPVHETDSLSADTKEVSRVETRQLAAPRDSILVVDDNAAVCAYLARLLQDEYDVRTAANGADALRLARERVPNLVLADVMMPGLDGVGLLRALRDDAHTCMVPVILISARVGEESRAEGLENGADDYLIKPFTGRELRARVAAHLRIGAIRQAAIQQERELRTALEAFLATLSHELRSPLQAAWAAIGVLRTRVPQDRFLDVLDRQMAYLRRLVDDLLDAARIAHGKIQLQRTRQDCRQLAAEAADIVRPSAVERGIELSVETPTEELVVAGDGVRLMEVLTNLLNNAVRYTDDGGRVLVRAARSEGAVEIRVSDTGKGIATDVLPKIFDLFGQGVEGLQGGLGIGLAVAARLVQLHGGTVEAHSDGPGRGSEFVVRLPAST